ncbi:MAG: hypothetical protein AB1483_14245 [Candidatus Zixiibacteriota bacterium]
MRTLITFMLLVLLAANLSAQDDDKVLDNNTAFFEGANHSYIMTPPDNFVMVMEPAISDGYSFAFIPDGESYDSASVMIGINIFSVKEKIRESFSLEQLIMTDTSSIREHYGPTLVIEEVAPMVTKNQFTLRNIFLNDTTTFIPNVMFSYLDGGGEVLIFDLSISPDYPRFMAEQAYNECLNRLKVLVKGQLDAG